MCTKSIEDGTRTIMCTQPHRRVPGRGHICPARDPEWDAASWLLFNPSPPGIGSPTGQIWKKQYLRPPRRDRRAHTHTHTRRRSIGLMWSQGGQHQSESDINWHIYSRHGDAGLCERACIQRSERWI